jgi:hypothetical protein
MITTRNFFLYLLCVAILVIAIAATAIVKSERSEPVVEYAIPPMSELSGGATVVGAASELDRAGRLVTLREKVASLVSAKPTEEIAEEVEVSSEPTVTTTEPSLALPDQCGDFKMYDGAWQPNGLSFIVVEGARLLTREVTGTSSETVLQLPLRTYPLPVQSCITTDVVAVALDGSLIRNDEVALYTIFGEETLIGYALDGFPIYGTTDTLRLDTCGGALTDAGYRYYLEIDRPYLLGCFAGIPAELPAL